MATKAKRPKPKLHTFILKAMWQNTAVKLKVEAKDVVQAWHKGWGQVSRMEGGESCLEVTFVSQVD